MHHVLRTHLSTLDWSSPQLKGGNGFKLNGSFSILASSWRNQHYHDKKITIIVMIMISIIVQKFKVIFWHVSHHLKTLNWRMFDYKPRGTSLFWMQWNEQLISHFLQDTNNDDCLSESCIANMKLPLVRSLQT